MLRRRSFLKTVAGAGGAGLVTTASLSNVWGAVADPYLPTIGLQLYTVRNQLSENKAKTIQAVATAGYRQVELMDVMTAADLVPLAKDNGMKVTSAFINWKILGSSQVSKDDGSMEVCIETAAKHGIKYLVFGYIGKGERETADKLKAIAERSNKAGDRCREAGIQLCYHHHSFEFEPLEGGRTGMDLFIEHFDPQLVPFEIDVFWAAIGGWDPVATLRRLKGRVVQVHLKDLLPGTPTIFDEGKVPKESFKEVGAGNIMMKAVLETARSIGVAQCHVEQDQSPDPVSSIGLSMTNLKAL